MIIAMTWPSVPNVHGSIPLTTLLKWRSGFTARYMVEVNGQSIGSTALTPLSVADCSQLRLGASRWATSIALLQVVDKLPHKCGVIYCYYLLIIVSDLFSPLSHCSLSLNLSFV